MYELSVKLIILVFYLGMDIDYLLVGQGIAGSVLSHQLLKGGHKIMVLGKKGLTVSGEVAAGLYNPITGRKMVKTWLADQLFPFIEPVYQEMERLSEAEFLSPLAVFRPFIDLSEQNDWEAKQGEPAFAPYIREIYDRPFQPDQIHNPYGGILLKNSGWLDVPAMMEAWKNYLVAQQSYREEEFDEGKLCFTEDGINYGDIKARKVIYCNGSAAVQSRYWSWVPFRPVKGELLVVKAPLETEHVINRGVFFLPLGGGIYKTGSTYDQRDLSPQPTEAARKDILERLSALIKVPVEVISHSAGIRPATKDRRPVVGEHPEHKTLVLFNGLGTKGVSLAPFCAQLLAQSLRSGNSLMPEIHINRFFSLYYSSQ